MIHVRGIRASDRDAVLSIHKRSIYGLCKDHYAEHEMKAWTDFFTPELFDAGMKDSNNVGVVAADSDTIIGFGFFNADARELRGLYVLPRYVNRGAGRLIMARLEDLARNMRIEHLSLLSTVNSVGFYRTLGYQVINEEKYRINDRVSIACVRMEKDLINNNAKGP